MNKKIWLPLAAGLALVGSGAFAADIGNLSGQSCGTLTGTWHFVNNQTGGAAPGTLTAMWDTGNGGSTTCITGPSAVNSKVQHFYCMSSGTLTSATTGLLPGKLVLSDFTCETKPPPCDPKTQSCK